MFIPFFFVRELHLGLQHITHSTHRQQRFPAKGRDCSGGAGKTVKSEKVQTWRVQFQSKFMLNTSQYPSFACVGALDFSSVLRLWQNSDTNRRGAEKNTRCGAVKGYTGQCHSHSYLNLAHPVRSLENLFDPWSIFLVGRGERYHSGVNHYDCLTWRKEWRVSWKKEYHQFS